jgi:hypothetical protein
MSPTELRSGRSVIARVILVALAAAAGCTSFSDARDPGEEGAGGGSAGKGGGAWGGGGGSPTGGYAGVGGASGYGGGYGGAPAGAGGATGGQAGAGGTTGGSSGSAGSGGVAPTGGASGSGGSTGAAGAEPGSPVDLCITTVNGHRATKGLAPYVRWGSGEVCASDQAEAISKGQASPDMQKCGAWGATSCPDWPGPPETMITKCIDQIWSGNGEQYIASTSYKEIACGFYVSGAKVWALQMYR